MKTVVVVGAGAAGLAAVEALRKDGYDGKLTLLGEEPARPYDRPPLSKQVLAGSWDLARTQLRSPEHYAGLDLDLITGRAAVGLDIERRQVLLDGTERLPFDGLIIATGVAPRRLPFGHELAGVHVLRGAHDAEQLAAALASRPRLVVIGGGFLGAEAAATARTLGLQVTLADLLAVPLHRQLGEIIGRRAARLHRAAGVRLRMGLPVDGIIGHAGRVAAVKLGDGSLEPADCVLVAIGSTPNIGWLRSSGLPLGDGVECDAYCRAGENVYAAGDVASWVHPAYGTRMRLEHRMNATEQGIAAARNMLLGDVAPFAPVPYFWTDQYDTRIQVHGVLPPGAEPAVVEGDPASDRFTVLYRQGGRTHAVLTWNNPKSARRYRSELVAASSAIPSHGGDNDRNTVLDPL
jgi:NADPH-dependent 2,4-dienoyl-CoA reductase/sulfur reductase-like enzyme